MKAKRPQAGITSQRLDGDPDPLSARLGTTQSTSSTFGLMCSTRNGERAALRVRWCDQHLLPAEVFWTAWP
jgi:hypothetical protein